MATPKPLLKKTPLEKRRFIMGVLYPLAKDHRRAGRPQFTNDLNAWEEVEQWLESRGLINIFAANVCAITGCLELSSVTVCHAIRATAMEKTDAFLMTIEIASLAGKIKAK